MIHRPLEDWEYPDPDDEEDDELAVDTRPCPTCGAEVYEDAQRCALCGEYVTFRNPALEGWPWWFVALGLVGIIGVMLALSGV
ncbi:zinc ribbon domain-containing protein [Adhaeretor mobilis]|uniref:Zinc ribbon domain-containing protein n=1 Tax=Adhaeretor mobilis TaxID=1930276 RepID=A0A517N2U7_9BACT|nr:zinc ribbon domain-containing protein [Adhaeretor mobilis]QDT01461.1 hypothetical protein HG15A2_48030 [Adhaeretor mobilis]